VSSRSIQYAVTDPNAYDRLIRRMAGRHKVDAALVKAVMHVESAFNPHAVSHKGAQGLMQVMPETGQRYGAEDLFDPVQNVEAAVLYLKDLQKMFKNNTRLVLAAYNAGENAVLRYRGIPPYRETRGYVRKVLGMHRQYAATIVPATRVVAKAPAVPAQAVTPAAIMPVAVIEPSASTPPEKNL
jgi:soluble lytic murein transglycosylase-like protein